MKSLSLWLLLAGLAVVQTAFADVRLPHVFGSGMVLQRRKPIPVWGWGTAGERVTVKMGKRTQRAVADRFGQWMLHLPAMEAGGPYQLSVKGKRNTLTLTNVLVGDVWVCSGQSNMEWPLASAKNALAEIRAANYPKIRQFLVKRTIGTVPQEDVEGDWKPCTPDNAAGFTAVGYFFARDLQKELNVPIGLINTSWGGTHIETWTSRDGLAKDPDLGRTVTDLPTTTDEIQRDGRNRMTRRLAAHQHGQLPTPATEREWPKPAFDVSEWRTMQMPGDWEWAGLPVFDGVVWFRRDVTIPDGTDLRTMTLNLGSSNDTDSAYVNGVLVGTTRPGDPDQHYAIPVGVLKYGRNVIAIRVDDTGGPGGLMGSADQLKLAGPTFDEPLTGDWQYRIARVYPASYDAGPNTYPTLLYNGMVKPLMPYAIKGVIWYQGESNADRANQYRRAFPLLIRDWRDQWANAEHPASAGKTGTDFPFLFVQLANFGSSDNSRGSNWAELREAQTMALALPNTGMVVTADIGDGGNIHPRNKQDVGHRLAAEALRVAYGQKRISSGPSFEGMTVDDNRVTVTFKNTGSGLMTTDKYGYLRGFEVAGGDHTFYPARAFIVGNKVLINASDVKQPVAIRYGWANNNGEVNLFNKEGFPAVPFRTDTWKGITEGVRFGSSPF